MQIGTGWSGMTPVIKNLLIINGLMFLASITFIDSLGIDLWDILGLHYPDSQKFEIYQVVSYMFMHGGVTHLLFNMFALWLFGSMIERTWGSRRFLVYYVLTGLGAAFLHYLIFYFEVAPELNAMEAIVINPDAGAILSFASNHEWQLDIQRFPEITEAARQFQFQSLNVLEVDPGNQSALEKARIFMSDYIDHYKNLPVVVGASGSLFGILIAFGMMFGNMRIFLLFPPIPIKAKWLVIAYGASEVIAVFQDTPGDNVAHFAHIGGMLFGFLIIKFWQKTGKTWK